MARHEHPGEEYAKKIKEFFAQGKTMQDYDFEDMDDWPIDKFVGEGWTFEEFDEHCATCERCREAMKSLGDLGDKEEKP